MSLATASNSATLKQSIEVTELQHTHTHTAALSRGTANQANVAYAGYANFHNELYRLSCIDAGYADWELVRCWHHRDSASRVTLKCTPHRVTLRRRIASLTLLFTPSVSCLLCSYHTLRLDYVSTVSGFRPS